MRALQSAALVAWLVTALTGCRAQEEAVAAGSAAAGRTGGPVVFPPAEYFQMKDHRGKTVDLRDFKGKVVVLNFWATWCGPCRYEIPHLVDLRKGFSPEKVVIIGVSLDRGPVEEIQPLLIEFIDHYGINYPVVLDSEFELIRQYFKRDLSTLGVPTTYVIDQQGRVYSVHEGLPRGADGRPDPGQVLGAEVQKLLERI